MRRAAVIGHGYWGKNIARVFNSSSEFELVAVCDRNDAACAKAKKLYPNITTVSDPKQLADDIDTVAVITPVGLHFPLARYFLERGKNVLVTKPATQTVGETEELLALADKQGTTFFVDNTFVFNPAVRTLKNLMPRVGKPYFVISQRLNLGLFQPDVNVIMDLMPHDLAIIAYLFDASIESANTSALHVAGLPQADLAHSTFTMTNGVKGLVTASWLAPAKVRQFFVVGSDGMLSYDDVAVSEKIRFYDKGISFDEKGQPDSLAAYTARISYRAGDMYSPAVPNYEALELEISEFAKAIADPTVRTSYNTLNLHIMKNLQAILDGVDKRAEVLSFPSPTRGEKRGQQSDFDKLVENA